MYTDTPITALKESPVSSQCLIGRDRVRVAPGGVVTDRASRALIPIAGRGEGTGEFSKAAPRASTEGAFKKNATFCRSMGPILLLVNAL